jgi:acetyl esterase/lipase
MSCAPTFAQATATPPAKATRTVKDLAYAPDSHERHKLDLYLPSAGENWPLIVWIHGGAWLAGDKLRPPALAYLDDGYAVASINYRLSQHATFPAQLEDCKAAIRWLRDHAAEYGYDGERIGVWGASAGGHLVALVGTTGDSTEFDAGENLSSSRVQAVVDFFGPTDFLQIGAQSLPTSRLDHDAPDSPEARLIGGPILQNKDKASRANPIVYISKDDPPFLIAHGEKDDVVPIGQSELLHAALQKAGVPSTLHRVPNAGHGFGGPEIDRLVLEFFNQHLKAAPAQK